MDDAQSQRRVRRKESRRQAGRQGRHGHGPLTSTLTRAAAALLLALFTLGASPSTNVAGDYAAGYAAFRRGDFDETIRLNAQIIAAAPAGRYLESAYVMRGLGYFRKGENELAIADYDQAIALNTASAVSYYDRGLAYRHQGNDDAALRDFGEALRLDPRYADVYDDRALVYRSQRKYDAAIADLDRAVTLAPAVARHLANRGDTKIAKSDVEAGLRDVRAALALDKSASLPHEILAGVYFRRLDYEAAVAELDQAIALHPLWPTVYVQRGVAKRRLGDTSGALADFRQGARFRLSAPAAEYELGITSFFSGDPAHGRAPLAYAVAYSASPQQRAYAALWQTIADMRANTGHWPPSISIREPTPVEAAARAAWPGPVMQMLYGRVLPDAVRSAALAEDPTGVRGYACEADYYTAEYDLATSRRAEVIPLLRRALATCPTNFIEYEAAGKRLGQLGG
ncbi:MAG: tetratricopeptide repeat protein [Candidatus Eremiobacteraeota bacterium]|nr:tetratricopeptide repeat protein [Candidatus Eremiobacteraeota bacterium]